MPFLPGLTDSGEAAAMPSEEVPRRDTFLPGLTKEGEAAPMPSHEDIMAHARERARTEVQGEDPSRLTLPFVSPILAAADAYQVRQARQRMHAGNPEPADFDIIARHERTQELEQQSGFTGQLSRTAVGLPAMATEAAAGGAAVGRLIGATPAGASLLSQAGRFGARQVASAPLMPSLYLQDWQQRGGSASNLGGALTHAALANIVLGAAGSLGGQAFQGSGIGQALGRTVMGGAVMAGGAPIADQIAKTIGASDHAPFFEALMKGKYGEAGQQAGLNFLTGAAFSMMHEPGRDHAAQMINPFVDRISALQRHGYSVAEAANRAAQEMQTRIAEGMGQAAEQPRLPVNTEAVAPRRETAPTVLPPEAAQEMLDNINAETPEAPPAEPTQKPPEPPRTPPERAQEPQKPSAEQSPTEPEAAKVNPPVQEKPTLTPREQHIIDRRMKGESHEKIGASIGVSKQRVQQLEKEILAKMGGVKSVAEAKKDVAAGEAESIRTHEPRVSEVREAAGPAEMPQRGVEAAEAKAMSNQGNKEVKQRNFKTVAEKTEARVEDIHSRLAEGKITNEQAIAELERATKHRDLDKQIRTLDKKLKKGIIDEADYDREHAKLEAEYARRAGAVEGGNRPPQGPSSEPQAKLPEAEPDTSFDPSALEGAPGIESSRARIGAERPEPVDPGIEAARGIATEEAGTLHVPSAQTIKEFVGRAASHAIETAHWFRNAARKLAGAQAPNTTSLDREVGEKVTRLGNADPYARQLTPHMIDTVMGPGATQADRRTWGAALVEMRLRFMKRAYLDQAAAASRDASLARGRGDQKAAAENARLATEAMQAARDVKTIVGSEDADGNKILADDRDYMAVLSDPRFREVLDRFREHMVPLQEENYRMAQGLADDEPIKSFTQMPDLPFNLKAIRAGEDVTPGTVFVGGRGAPRAQKIRQFGFAKRATGASEGYEVDLGAIIQNTIMHGTRRAAMADAVRTAVDHGMAQWGYHDQPTEINGSRAVQIPNVEPPRGTQANEPRQKALYWDRRSAEEFKQAAGMIQPGLRHFGLERTSIPGTGALTWFNLASLGEATSHTLNLMTMAFKPGWSPVDFARNAWGRIQKNPEMMKRIVELAQIGAMKEHGYEANALLPERSLLRRMNESALNPMTWVGKALTVVDHTQRLSLDQAFSRLVRQGRVQDTETNRRDFINQLGNYNKNTQNRFVAFMRDTGLGPFATAGTNFYMQSFRSLSMNPGAKATSNAQAVGLRAEMLARTLGILAIIPVVNLMRWGRADGDDKTPYGAIKLGDKPDGSTVYFDLARLTGVTRGMNQLGAMNLIEGHRAMGRVTPTAIGRGLENAGMRMVHPFLGPPAAFAHTAITGRDMLGRNVALHADVNKGEVQAFANLAAALRHVNPIYAAVTGADKPDRESTLGINWRMGIGERAGQALGVVGPRARATRPGEDFRRRR